MSGVYLRISAVEGWDPTALGTSATSLADVVETFDALLASILVEQDDLAESWSGSAASAAADRVVAEKTAGSRIAGAIDVLREELKLGAGEIDTARSFVLTKRDGFINRGFEVDDTGVVTAQAKLAELHRAGADGAAVVAASLEVMTEAARLILEMLEALRYAADVARELSVRVTGAGEAITRTAITESPPPMMRSLPDLSGGWQADGSAPPSPEETYRILDAGREVRVSMPDGSTHTIIPNPDGTHTVAQSVTDASGVTTVTATTNGSGTAAGTTTTVMTPRGDGIIETAVTGPTGTVQRSRTVPTGDNRNETFAINPGGTQGPRISESHRTETGAVVTEMYRDGFVDRQTKSPDGFSTYETFAVVDGQRELVETSNSARVVSRISENGDIVTDYPDGSGAVTRTLDDGRVVTEFSDESVLVYDPEAAGMRPML